MKNIQHNLIIAFAAFFIGILAVHAEDASKPKIKPYVLDTCAVCGMKFGEMGKPYAFVYKDRQINVCDKEEEAEFKKEPAKYLKKIAAAEAKTKK